MGIFTGFKNNKKKEPLKTKQTTEKIEMVMNSTETAEATTLLAEESLPVTESPVAPEENQPDDSSTPEPSESKNTEPVTTTQESAGEPEPEHEVEKKSMFSDLFQQVEIRAETPLEKLINSLSDVEITELLAEAEELKAIMQDWQQ